MAKALMLCNFLWVNASVQLVTDDKSTISQTLAQFFSDKAEFKPSEKD